MHLLTGKVGDIISVEKDAAVTRFDEADHALSDGGLTRTRLPHQPQGLATRDLEAHVVYGFEVRQVLVEKTAARRKRLAQVTHFEEGPIAHGASG